MLKLPMNSIVLCVLFAAVTAEAGEAWMNVTHENEPGLAGNEIQFIKPGKDGRMWIGTMEGLSSAKNGKFSRVLDPEKSKKNNRPIPLQVTAWDVHELPDALWIGHDRGTAKLTEHAVTHTLEGNTVAPLVSQNDTLLALATDRSTEEIRLYVLKNGVWELGADPQKFQAVDVFQHGGTLWVTLDGNGVLKVDNGRTLNEGEHHLPSRNVTHVHIDSDGRAWCGLWDGGVLVLEDGKWNQHLAGERSAVLNIVEDSKGNIWVATSANGVWMYDGETWVNHLREEGSISMLAATRDGRVWVSSQQQGGLRYWNGSEWILCLDSPLPIRCVVQAPNGDIWAGGILDGIHILKK